MADQPLPAPAIPRYYDVAPRRYWPSATIALLTLNFLIFGLEIHAGGADNGEVLLNFGAAFGPLLRRGEYWRLVMPIFLHGGWLHILGNSYALYILGPLMERVYGYGRYLTIYIASGITGAFLSMTFSTNISVGASGAIFGIAGAMLVMGYVHRDVVPRRWGRAFGQGMIPFILLNFAWGLSVHGIDNWGHLGGLLGGALLAFLVPPPRQSFVHGEVAETPSQRIVVLPLAIVMLSMVATFNHYRAAQALGASLVQADRYAGQKQYGKAIQSYQDALRKQPDFAAAHNNLAWLYATCDDPQFRDPKAALQHAQRAVLLSNWREGEFVDTLAEAYFANGEYAQAVAVQKKALALAPGDPQLQAHMRRYRRAAGL
jgi:rhomboid protease GluP